jgi:hypothetical protein
MLDGQDLLPKRTAELVQVVGFEVAMVLVKQFGGTHLNIPKKAKSQHPLVSSIGIEAFEKLCCYYGGTKLEIDLCSDLINQKKEQLILAALKAGKTNAQLARQFNTTERQIPASNKSRAICSGLIWIFLSACSRRKVFKTSQV